MLELDRQSLNPEMSPLGRYEIGSVHAAVDAGARFFWGRADQEALERPAARQIILGKRRALIWQAGLVAGDSDAPP
jgi:hypothetical protein